MSIIAIAANNTLKERLHPERHRRKFRGRSMAAVDHIVEAFVDLNLDIISDGVRLSFYVFVGVISCSWCGRQN